MTVLPLTFCARRTCGRRLKPDGPSPWWCGSKCQAIWQAEAATSPGTMGAQLAEQILADTKPDEPPVTEEAYDRYLDLVAELRPDNSAIATPDEAAADRAHATTLAAQHRHRRASWVHLATAGITLGAGLIAAGLGHATVAVVGALSAALPTAGALVHRRIARAHRGAALARAALTKETETR